MSRSWANQADGQWVGQVYCDRFRCDVKHTWPVANPPTNRPVYNRFRITADQSAEFARQSAIAQAELDEHQLPDGWVTVTVNDSQAIDGTNRTRQFHTPHCAALWLDRYATPRPPSA